MLFLALLAQNGYSQSSRPGWGATPYAGPAGTGVTFRVWAPNASSIRVFGTFNGWNTNSTPLIREMPTNAGIWSVDVPAARPGHEFKYSINNRQQRRDPRSRQVVHSGAAASVIYDPTAYQWGSREFLPPPPDKLVVYEMHIGTFHDPNPGDGEGGTFYDAITRLDHVAALGANAVQLMPVSEFAGDNSWGYNPSDPFAVESSYGGPDGLKAFVDACHTRGLAVLLDVVHNHYGPSDLENSLWQFDGWAGPSGGGIYFYQDATNRDTKWGPRPDYSRPEVRSYIADNTRMWIEEYRVDGLRWDATLYMRFSTNFTPNADGAAVLREASSLMSTEFPDAINIAEDHYLDGLVTAPLPAGLGFDSEWIRAFHVTMTAQMTNDAGRDLEVVGNLMTFTNGSSRLIYLESHDEAGDHNAAEGALRFPTEIAPTNPAGFVARRTSTMAATLMMASPGIPMIFQGQEMLENELFGDLLPVDWSKTNTQSGIVRLYTDIIGLKENRAGVTPGLSGPFTSTSVTNDGTMLLVRRGFTNAPEQDVYIVANFSTNYIAGLWINFPTNGTWYAHFNSDDAAYSPDYQSWGSSQVFAWDDNRGDVYLAPRSVLVLSKFSHAAADADRDGMPDSWEATNGLSPQNPSDAWANPDRDAYRNLQEFRAGTPPAMWNQPASVFSAMSVAGDFSAWNPGSNTMARIADGLWQRDMTIGVSRIEFKFAANSDWADNWGIVSQQVFRAPFTLGAEYYGDNIVISNLAPGIYRFRFNEQTKAFTVRPTLLRDSDIDGLPDDWEIANGLDPLVSKDDHENPDGDLYDNTEEYRRGFDPLVWNKPLTDYSSMALLSAPNNWLFAGSFMQQNTNVHYTWSVVTNLATTNGIQFKFAANGGLARTWAMNSANQFGVPFTNVATYLGNWNVVVTQSLNGNYRFTLNEQSREFSVVSDDADTDSDGLPDWWETQYFGSSTGAVASSSPDGDVYSNLEEYRKITDPTAYDLPAANYSSMAVAATFNNWNPSPNMQLVDHHLWRATLSLTNATDAQFKFAANGNWTDNWGKNVSGNLPLLGAADKNIINNIQINGAVNGPVVFTFNDQTYEFRASYDASFTEMGAYALDAAPGGPFVIRWSSSSNQVYRVLRSTNLTSGFTTLLSSVPATPPMNVHTTVAVPSDMVFFQILVNP